MGGEELPDHVGGVELAASPPSTVRNLARWRYQPIGAQPGNQRRRHRGLSHQRRL